MPTPLQKIKEAKEARIAALEVELALASAQIAATHNEVHRQRIRRQIEQLEQDINTEYDGLRQYEVAHSVATGNQNQAHLYWEERLPLIDFTRATNLYDKIVRRFGRAGGAALFLMQNSVSMGGDWCLQRLKDEIRRTAGPNTFTLYRVEFLNYQPLDQSSLLAALGRYVGVQPDTDLHVATDEIIDKICGSVQSASIVFIELHTAHGSELLESFLTWFVDHFWTRLVSRLPQITEQLPLVKFIAVIISSRPLDRLCLRELRCTPRQWSERKILELPLQRWEEHDIQLWLYTHSGLTSPAINLRAPQIDQAARMIYESSDGGKPRDVYFALRHMLEKTYQELS